MSGQRSQVAVIGGGGLGSLFAARAAVCGADVTVCVRTPIDTLRLDGLLGDGEVPARLVTSPDAVGPTEWVFLTTKAYDTESAVPWLDALVDPDSTLVVVQNGVDQVERLRPLVPATVPIIPTLAYVSVEPLAPGQFIHRVGNLVIVPEDEATERLAALLADAGFDLRRDPDFRTAAWRKFLGNLVGNPITALTLRRVDVIREPGIQELIRRMLEEAIAVGIAEGAKLDDGDVERTFEAFRNFSGGETGSSMLFDRFAGRRIEHELMSGYIVRAGRRHGIPTPVHDVLWPLLEAIDGRRPDEADKRLQTTSEETRQ